METRFTKTCPECQEEMELITADDVGEVLVYECPECGYQEESRVERNESDDADAIQPEDVLEFSDVAADEEPDELPDPDETE
ncbi:MAG TPA: zf-TFIIB domain-containing protein [bacterium]|nr:zf-TFIIB domain-containing protein [bacterium]